MLLIILPAVCKEKGSPFGNRDVCHAYGMACASLSTAIGAIYLWSYVYNIVRVSSKRSSEQEEHRNPSTRTEEREIELAVPQDKDETKPLETDLSKIKQRFEKLFEKMNLKRVFAPTTTAAITGFVIGLVPQIRKLMIGASTPLGVIQDTALLLGGGAIPAVTLILGGNLLKGLKGSGIKKSIILGIVIVRFIALPLIGIAIVKGAVWFGVVHDNLLYKFVLLLQFSLPPAMHIGTITQLFGAGESECAVIMLWCYTLASVALTFWATCYLWLVS